jgi:hypothetical protein
MSAAQEIWPPLPLTAWQDTYQTLHMYTQIVGKIRLAYSPMMNQWWQVPLYLTARGLTTSPIPYDHRTFEMEFDFFDHHLIVQTSDSKTRRIALGPPVKDFYREMMETLRAVGIEAHIWTQPVEVPDPIPFEKDNRHASYDPRHAHRFWQILKEVEIVFGEFRARFTGKCSPVHVGVVSGGRSAGQHFIPTPTRSQPDLGTSRFGPKRPSTTTGWASSC